MKRFSQRTGYSSMAELNVTPLLDLAFVLLIIFIITTPLLEQGIQVTVPSSSPQTVPYDPQKVRTVSIDRDGQITLDGEKTTLPQIEAQLSELAIRDPEASVGLRADKSLPYEKIIDVLDAVQRSGIKRFGLVTRSDESRR